MDNFKEKVTKTFTFGKSLNHDIIINEEQLPFNDGSLPVFLLLPRLESCRKAIFLQCGLAGTVLLFNIIMLGYAAGKYEIDKDGLGTLFTGSCRTAHKADIGIHFFVNLLSTTLLAASNYCMQCLVAPTRSDIDKAHANKRYVDIGIPSLKNLQFIPWKRIMLWSTLILSSLPLHLLFNSVVFQTTSANIFNVVTVSPPFFASSPETLNDILQDPLSTYSLNQAVVDDLGRYHEEVRTWTNMSNSECLKEYGKGYVSKWANLLLVLKNDDSYNQSELVYQSWMHDPTFLVPYSWMCNINYDTEMGNQPGSCLPSKINPNQWILEESKKVTGLRYTVIHNISSVDEKYDNKLPPRQYKIDYCMAQPSSENCKLKFSQTILIVVILMNAAKAACMLLIAACSTHKEPFLTIGDAVASFMQREDPHTAELCAAPFPVINDPNQWDMGRHAQARRLGNYSRRWMDSASQSRWVVTTVFGFLVIFASGMLIMPATMGDKANGGGAKSAVSIWNDGLGELQPDALLNMPVFNTLLKNIILSNTPQLVLSVLYLLLNALFTCMLANLEWTKFGVKRSNLRVSFPRKGQRSTYRLQLPYRYGIPLLIFSLLFHWLVSQSLFVAQIDILVQKGDNITDVSLTGYYNSIAPDLTNSTLITDDGRRIYSVITTCGYSVLAIIMAMVACFLALVALVAVGYFKKYSGRMQLGATCSVIVSAACHSYRPIDGDGVELKRLQWGEIEEVSKASDTGSGHLTFTSGDVIPPDKEGFYGVPRELTYRAMKKEFDDSVSISSSIDQQSLTFIPLYP